MSEGDIEEHLIALGVPRHVAAYVAEQRPIRLPTLGGFGAVLVMVAGFAVGGFLIWPISEAYLDLNARTAAATLNALLYHHNFGFGLLIALFAWIGLSGVIVGAIPMLTRRLAAGQFYDSVINAASSGDNLSGRAARWGVEKMMRELEHEPDPARYVARASFAWVKPAAIISGAAMVIAAVVTIREVNAYTLFFADRYEQNHTFQLSRTVREWSDVTRVEVGCNHVTGDNASEAPIYEVHFSDGGSVRIDGAFPLSGSWIDQVEKIDTAIVAAGAEFQPWTWLDREAHHPQCLMAHAVTLGAEDYARFRRLIRAPD